MNVVTDQVIEIAARAIDEAQVWSRRNKSLNPPKVEICRYGMAGEPEIVVLHTADWTSDEGIVRSIVASRYRARACLMAVLPDLIEACAKVADEWPDEVKGDIPHLSRIEFADTSVQIMMGECARRIRALIPDSHQHEKVLV